MIHFHVFFTESVISMKTACFNNFFMWQEIYSSIAECSTEKHRWKKLPYWIGSVTARSYIWREKYTSLTHLSNHHTIAVVSKLDRNLSHFASLESHLTVEGIRKFQPTNRCCWSITWPACMLRSKSTALVPVASFDELQTTVEQSVLYFFLFQPRSTK